MKKKILESHIDINHHQSILYEASSRGRTLVGWGAHQSEKGLLRSQDWGSPAFHRKPARKELNCGGGRGGGGGFSRKRLRFLTPGNSNKKSFLRVLTCYVEGSPGLGVKEQKKSKIGGGRARKVARWVLSRGHFRKRC